MASTEPRVVPISNLREWIPNAAEIPNPMGKTPGVVFVRDDECIRQDVTGHAAQHSRARVKDFDAFVRAGPRPTIAFVPEYTNACVVTTGGLCPGLNTVIEELVTTFCTTYGGGKVFGLQYGFRGFDTANYPPVILNADNVRDIHTQGGSFLGSGRGKYDEQQMMGFIREHKIGHVYMIGGDGSHRAARDLHNALRAKQIPTVVVAIPKTIDNDILYFDKTFGFDSAVEAANRVVQCAYVEAKCMENGVGLVKLMGRESGFVARNTALSSNMVDACLIPEVPLNLYGEKNGLLTWLKEHLKTQRCAVIVMAESAGQDLMPSTELDSTGHKVYQDVGQWLKGQIEKDFKKSGLEGKVFYIDPSYMIRSVPANTSDNMMCIQLAQAAVHTAFSGFSGVTVGQLYSHFAILPIDVAVASTKKVHPRGSLWQKVIARSSFKNLPEPPKSHL
eukprot:NODE_1027_length_1753_cov_54.685446_g906_i0.p1 GENE.NODE_1027_length_1753_cov_54.685446_g906_i0~~NODE_1027_length_1753_cov_54.685446_g906_i0.p1  ORF type:complete len:447 (-),score=79.34 NODE_1027_length_1753_cov_54.685446_g906_i0:326-1666(-)